MTNCMEICTMRAGRFKWNKNCEERRAKGVTSVVRVRTPRTVSELQSQHPRQDLPGTTQAKWPQLFRFTSLLPHRAVQDHGLSPRLQKAPSAIWTVKLKVRSCTEISSTQICVDRNCQHFEAQVKRTTASQIPSLWDKPHLCICSQPSTGAEARSLLEKSMVKPKRNFPQTHSHYFYCAVLSPMPWAPGFLHSHLIPGAALSSLQPWAVTEGTQRSHQFLQPQVSAIISTKRNGIVEYIKASLWKATSWGKQRKKERTQACSSPENQTKHVSGTALCVEITADKKRSTKSPSVTAISSRLSRAAALPAEPFAAVRPEAKFQKESFLFCNTHLPGLTDPLHGVLHEHQEFMTGSIQGTCMAHSYTALLQVTVLILITDNTKYA